MATYSVDKGYYIIDFVLHVRDWLLIIAFMFENPSLAFACARFDDYSNVFNK